MQRKKTWRAIYHARCKAEGKRFGNVMCKDDQKCDMFKNAKWMCKTKHDIIVEPCIKKDDGISTYSDEYKKKNLHTIGTELSQVNTSKYS